MEIAIVVFSAIVLAIGVYKGKMYFIGKGTTEEEAREDLEKQTRVLHDNEDN